MFYSSSVRTYITTSNLCICINDISCAILNNDDTISIYRIGINEPIILENITVIDENKEETTLYDFIIKGLQLKTYEN